MAHYQEVVKEMGLTHNDFFRTVKNAIGKAELVIHPDGVVVEEKQKKLCIRLGPEKERRLGSLRFPVTQVKISFYG